MRLERHRFAALVGAVAFAAYLNSLPNALVYDDHALVRLNRSLDDPSRLVAFFTGDLWTRLGLDPTNYYRPLPALLLAAVHAVSGDTPWAYRMVNLLLHAAASVLVLRLLLDLQRDRPEIERPHGERAALAGALLFAVHPVHVEAVAWVSGIMDVACAAFALLAFDLYRRADDSPEGRWRLAGALTAFLLAMLAKEPAVVLPAWLLIYETCRPRPLRSSAPSLARRLLPWLGTLGLYLGLRAVALGGFAPQGRLTPPTLDAWLRLAVDLYARYLQALFVPVGLSLGHAAPPESSWSSPRSLAGIAAVVTTAAVARWAWRRDRGALFGLALLVVSLAPVLYVPGMVMPLSKLFAERYLYLPSVGWVAVAASGLRLAATRAGRRQAAVWAASAALVALFAVLTVRQNRIWRSEVALWADAVAKYPAHGGNHLDYGNALLAAGDEPAARREFGLAFALDPAVLDLLVHQGRQRLESGRPREALLKFEQALALAPASFDALLGSADAANAAGWTDRAEARYRLAIERRPDSAAARNGYGYLLARQGRLDAAVEQFEAAVRAAPDDPVPLRNLASVVASQGDAARAAGLRARAAALDAASASRRSR